MFDWVVVQSVSYVRLFVTPWTTAHQASLSFTASRRLLKLVSIESVMPSNHIILCLPLLFPPSIFLSIRSFPVSQFFASGGQIIGVSASSCLQSFPKSGSFPMSQFFTPGGKSIGVSASASMLSMKIQTWFPLGLPGLIFLLSKGLSRVFSSTTVQKHQFW